MATAPWQDRFVVLSRSMRVHVQVRKALVRPGSLSTYEPLVNGAAFVFSSDELLSELLDVVVECAGHFALTSIAPLCCSAAQTFSLHQLARWQTSL